MSRRHRKKKELFGAIPELSMTPLIDVAWTLLVIFIVSSPMIHHSIKVNLPHGKIHEVKGTTKNNVVYVEKNGRLSFNGDLTNKKALLSLLQNIPNKQDTLFIQADKNVDYGTVIELIDEMKRAGVKHVALATKKSA